MGNIDGTITLDVRKYMDEGLMVYDVERKRVGTVDEYDLRAGYMKVQPNPLSKTLLYLPFSLISHIDPHEAFVSMPRDMLQREYGDPPPRITVVEKRSDPDTGEDTSRALTSEPSGYDGTPVLVVTADVGELAHHIAPGFRVYSSEMETIGRVKEYYREDKRMLVQHGLPSKHDSIIPVALAATVDRDHRHVILAVSAADLRRQARPLTGDPELDEVVLVAAE